MTAASGVNRAADINNVTTWASLHNLTLIMATKTEIIIYDSGLPLS